MSTGRQKVLTAWQQLLCLSALAYAGDDTAPEEAWSQIGFAIAAVKACPKVQINSDGMKDLTDSLDSEDQAKVFTDSTGVEKATNQADKTFVLAGDRACDIAFDHMNKSKVQVARPCKLEATTESRSAYSDYLSSAFRSACFRLWTACPARLQS